MRLLDSDVMIDILRKYPPALNWLSFLGNEQLGLPGFVVSELLTGCQNKKEVKRLESDLKPYKIYWPTVDDCNRALEDYAKSRLSQSLGILDALIGECAVGLNVILCTFNTKHFKAIAGLKTEQPYKKMP